MQLTSPAFVAALSAILLVPVTVLVTITVLGTVILPPPGTRLAYTMLFRIKIELLKNVSLRNKQLMMQAGERFLLKVFLKRGRHGSNGNYGMMRSMHVLSRFPESYRYCCYHIIIHQSNLVMRSNFVMRAVVFRSRSI